MKTPKYTRAQAMSLIPLLEGITAEIHERRDHIDLLGNMIKSLAASAHVHGEDVKIRREELRRERLELRRIGQELEGIGCHITLTDPFEIFIPGIEDGYGWRPGEGFLRRSAIEPFAA
jgi:hypothetical protein